LGDILEGLLDTLIAQEPNGLGCDNMTAILVDLRKLKN